MANIYLYIINRKCHDFNLYLSNIHTFCIHSFVTSALIHSTPRNVATWIHKIYIRNGLLSILWVGMRKLMAMLTFGKNSRKCTRFYTILFDFHETFSEWFDNEDIYFHKLVIFQWLCQLGWQSRSARGQGCSNA